MYDSITALEIDHKEIVPWRMQFRTEGIYPAEIRIYMKDGGMCSGVVISDQYALTAAHCAITGFLRRMDRQPVHIAESNGLIIARGKFVAIEKDRDVALIKADFSKFSIKVPNFNYETVQGTNVRACGYPADTPFHCSYLTIVGNSYFRYEARGDVVFRGMSGGAVYDSHNYVVAVNSAATNELVLLGPLVGLGELWGIQ